jgi:hypothetical protein
LAPFPETVLGSESKRNPPGPIPIPFLEPKNAPLRPGKREEVSRPLRKKSEQENKTIRYPENISPLNYQPLGHTLNFKGPIIFLGFTAPKCTCKVCLLHPSLQG